MKLAGETAPASRFGSLELQTRKGDGKSDFGVVALCVLARHINMYVFGTLKMI